MSLESPSLNRILIPLALGTGLSLIGDSALYTVLPVHTAEAGVTPLMLGVLLSANRWVRLVGNSGAGWLNSRFSRRKLFVFSVMLGAVSTAFYALTQGFWPLLLGRLLWGAAWSGIWITGNAIALDISHSDRRGRTVGIYHISFFLGAGLGAPIGGILTDWLGYRPAFGIAAGLTLLGGIIGWIFLPEIPPQKKKATHPAPEKPGSTLSPPSRWGEAATAVALQAVNRLLVAGILIGTFSFYLSDRFGSAINLDGRSIGITTISGLILGAGTMISVISSPAAGMLSDRLRQRWLVAAIGLTAGTAGFLALTGGPVWLILSGIPLIFLASASNQSLATALIGDTTPPHKRGRMLGLFYTAGDLASAIGPILAYWIIAKTGGAGANYLLAASVSAAMGGLALFWWRRTATSRTVISG